MILSKKIFLSTLCFLLLFFGVQLRTIWAFDHSALDAFLKQHVNEKGEVDYQSVAKDLKPLSDYLAHLMTADKLERKSWPREEVLAFWMNAYHATLLKLVAEHYPVSSVQKIPGFWDIALVRFGTGQEEKQYGLNSIRVNELIGIFHDEKIDLALCMAARGGPGMIREAFTGPKVEGQLFLLTRKFVNNPFFVDVTPGHKKIRISKIFKWYEKDFKLDFGTPEPLGKFSVAETSVLSFLAYYLEDDAKEEYLQGAGYKIEYPPFDWSLNDWKRNVT